MYIHVHPIAFYFLVSQYMIVKIVIIIVRLLDYDFCPTATLALSKNMIWWGCIEVWCLRLELVELNCWDSMLTRDIAEVVFIRLEQFSPLELVFFRVELDLKPKLQVKQSYMKPKTLVFYRGQTQQLTDLITSWSPFLTSASKCNAFQLVPSCSTCWLWIADTTTQVVLFMGHPW